MRGVRPRRWGPTAARGPGVAVACRATRARPRADTSRHEGEEAVVVMGSMQGCGARGEAAWCLVDIIIGVGC